jgi:hypothetical protein
VVATALDLLALMQTLLDLAVLVGVVRILALLVQGRQDREMLVVMEPQQLDKAVVVAVAQGA